MTHITTYIRAGRGRVHIIILYAYRMCYPYMIAHMIVSYMRSIYDHHIHEITSWYDILASGDIKLLAPDLSGEKVSGKNR